MFQYSYVNQFMLWYDQNVTIYQKWLFNYYLFIYLSQDSCYHIYVAQLQLSSVTVGNYQIL